MSDIIKKQLEAYRPNFLLHGNTPQGTFQNNTTTQFERFNQLLTPLLKHKRDKFSICDIGAGVCDLHKYLIMNKIEHEYYGIEIVPEMVETARKLYPNITITSEDFLSESFHKEFDFLVVSGTFNIPNGIEKIEWEEFIFKIISKMFHLARIGISFNALTTYATFYSDKLYYLDPQKTFAYIQKNLSRFCILNTAYPMYEVTYTVYKKSHIAIIFQEEDFAKYFRD
ncbi:MAG: class I SAM-dependent methyltransferase [Bacteroidia bacterium]|nr:class I SAM-dependent methyltransferase [Bacteroidia bacterium]MDW8302562.1 class I SAM-dependent methyltransferase [Bacteroidia bacterium]